MADPHLAELRKEITEIDDQIALLAAARMRLVARIASYKKREGIPLRDLPREAEILGRAAELAGSEYAGSVAIVFRALLDEGRSRLCSDE